jgi:hypothetical protein
MGSFLWLCVLTLLKEDEWKEGSLCGPIGPGAFLYQGREWAQGEPVSSQQSGQAQHLSLLCAPPFAALPFLDMSPLLPLNNLADLHQTPLGKMLQEGKPGSMTPGQGSAMGTAVESAHLPGSNQLPLCSAGGQKLGPRLDQKMIWAPCLHHWDPCGVHLQTPHMGRAWLKHAQRITLTAMSPHEIALDKVPQVPPALRGMDWVLVVAVPPRSVVGKRASMMQSLASGL